MMSDVKLGDLVWIVSVAPYEDLIGIVMQREGSRVRVMHNQPSRLVNPCDLNISSVRLVNPPEPDYNRKAQRRDEP